VARTGVDDLLEVVAEPVVRQTPSQPDGDAPMSSRQRWRAPWAVAVAALAVAIAALPVRSNLALRELHRLEQQWAWFKALDGQRATLGTLLATEAQDPGDARVVRGRAALATEESPLLRQARSRVLGGWHLPDRGLQRLRQAIGLVLADEAGDLADAGLPGASDSRQTSQRPTPLLIAEVDHLLAAQLTRFHQHPRTGSVATPQLRAAQNQLRALAVPTDQPVHARLVFAGPLGTLTMVDLSTGRGPVAAPRLGLPLHPVQGPIVPRAGYLAVGTAQAPFVTPVYAVSPGLSWLRVIGTTVEGAVVPAVDPDGVWLQSGATAVEVNGMGQTVRGPIAIGTNRVLVGATEQLLVTTSGLNFEPASDVEIVPFEGPQKGRARTLAVPAQLVAATAGHLAWMEQDSHGGIVIRVGDGAAKSPRTLAPPTAAGSTPASVAQGPVLLFPVEAGAFSPDNRLLAVRYLINAQGTGGLRLAIADLASGATRLIDGQIGNRPTGDLSWAPDGSSLFFDEASGSDVHIGIWPLGATQTSLVRVPVQDLLALTAIDAGR
jgi:hypothetical protein